MPNPSPPLDETPRRTALFIEGPAWFIRRIEISYGDKARELGSWITTDTDDPREFEASDEFVTINVKVAPRKGGK